MKYHMDLLTNIQIKTVVPKLALLPEDHNSLKISLKQSVKKVIKTLLLEMFTL